MIYFDNASTTKMDVGCLDAIKKYSVDNFYNPSAPYHEALTVSRIVKESRERFSSALKGDGRVIFTASGTESDNLALFGTKKAHGARILVSESEHPAVMRAALELKQRGYELVVVNVDSTGRVDFSDFCNKLDKNTALVSIMHVNNETGAVNDIKKLCAYVKNCNKSIIFHSDGVQALGKVPVDMRNLGVDLYSFSGHKFHAPKGIGGLFVKSGVNLSPIIYGGGQEFNIRSATENVAGCVSITECAERSLSRQRKNNEIVKEISAFIKNRLTATGKVISISDENCSPFVLCVAMKDVRGEVMLHSLEKDGIIIGTGSACSTHKANDGDWKLRFLPVDYRKGILRLSFCEENTQEEAELFMQAFVERYNELEKYARN